MGRALKQVVIAAVLSGVAAAVAGCTSMAPKVEPTLTAKPKPKVVRTKTAPKIVKQKKVITRKLIKPATENPEKPPPVIPAIGGGGGTGGSSGGSSGGGGNWGGG